MESRGRQQAGGVHENAACALLTYPSQSSSCEQLYEPALCLDPRTTKPARQSFQARHPAAITSTLVASRAIALAHPGTDQDRLLPGGLARIDRFRRRWLGTAPPQ